MKATFTYRFSPGIFVSCSEQLTKAKRSVLLCVLLCYRKVEINVCSIHTILFACIHYMLAPVCNICFLSCFLVLYSIRQVFVNSVC